MKIRDILRESEIKKSPVNYEKLKQDLEGKYKKLGQGLYGSAFKSGDDMIYVTKISRSGTKNPDYDGYISFVRKIKDLEGYPALPQITKVEEFEAYNSDVWHGKDHFVVVEMEKLFLHNDFTNEELMVVVEKLLGRELKKDELENQSPDAIWWIESLLASYISKAWGSKYVRTLKIIDREVMDALDIVKEMYNNGYSLDLHDQNFMFRRTPYGPQLVITDPLCSRMST